MSPDRQTPERTDDPGLSTPRGALLVLGGDSDRAAALLLEPVAGAYRLISWHALPLRLPTGHRSLAEGLAGAALRLGQRLERPLWHTGRGADPLAASAPALTVAEPALRLGLEQVVAAISPLTGVRVWGAGLAAGESLNTLQEAVACTPCDLSALFRLRRLPNPRRLARDLLDCRANIAVVTGGYDQPNAHSMETLRQLVAVTTEAIQLLPAEQRPALYFAGNQWLAGEVLARWQDIAGTEPLAVPNVLPRQQTLHPVGLAAALSERYWRLSLAHPDARRIVGWITRPAQPRSLEWSFAQGVRLWRSARNLAHLHGVWVGPRRWMHVWASADEQAVRVRFVAPQRHAALPPAPAGWPPVQLISGKMPDGPWTLPAESWYDPLGFFPMVSNVAQVAPQAAVGVMESDLLRPARGVARRR